MVSASVVEIGIIGNWGRFGCRIKDLGARQSKGSLSERSVGDLQRLLSIRILILLSGSGESYTGDVLKAVKI